MLSQRIDVKAGGVLEGTTAELATMLLEGSQG
jgi:hypothetical protein